MKILIVDDEPLARTRLRDLLEEMNDYTIVGEAANGREALQQAQTLQPDIILMDIRMPVMSGLEAARHLTTFRPQPTVIFTTAYGDHALEAFEADAIDYLLKPIRRARLQQALNKAPSPQPQLPPAVAEDDSARSHICAHQRGGLILIPVDEVYYFRADSKYVVVRHAKGEVLIDEPLKTLEEEFRHRFIRIHRNALVATARIHRLDKTPEGHHTLQLRGIDEPLAISRRQLPAVRKIISNLGE